MKEKIHRISHYFWNNSNTFKLRVYNPGKHTWWGDPSVVKEEAKKNIKFNNTREDRIFITTEKQIITIRKLRQNENRMQLVRLSENFENGEFGILENIEIPTSVILGTVIITFQTTDNEFYLTKQEPEVTEMYIESNQLTTKFYA